MDVVLVVCTCPDTIASGLGREILERRLAACVDILPGIWGIVGWQPDHLIHDEATMLITTADDLVEELYGAILEAHPASMAVIATLELAESYSSYIEWLQTTLADY